MVVLAFLPLVACGGGSDGPPRVQALVDELADEGITCSNLEIRDESPIVTREEGSCDYGADDRLTISTFNSNDARDAAVKIASDFGGIMVVGDRWGVIAEDDRTAERVAKALGGKVA